MLREDSVFILSPISPSSEKIPFSLVALLWSEPMAVLPYFLVILLKKHVFFIATLLYSPFDKSENIWYMTLAAPALFPTRVILFRSPPKCLIFWYIQSNAMAWSRRPKFPGASWSSVLRNPGEKIMLQINWQTIQNICHKRFTH